MATAPSILIVEDERIVAMDIQQTLRDCGYDAPAIASSADEALARVCERRPELVLMDIRINGARDGIDTAELLKSQFDVPIVYLTAHADDATLQRAKSTAPHGYLVKPIKAAELKSAVEISLARHDLERRLRQRERWFSATLDSIADAVVAVDLDGTVAFMNPVAESLTGVSAGTGRPVRDVLQLESGDGVEPVLAALREGRVVETSEGRLRNLATGETRSVTDSAAPVRDPRSGETLGAVVVFRDVTDREKLRARLELAERLASVGTLAAGVAHEVNNPLTVVVANAEYVKGELEHLPERPEEQGPQLRHLSQALADVGSAAERIGQIVADLKIFARRPAAEAGTSDVIATLEWALRATAHEFRSRARIVRRLAPVPHVAAEEGRLGQVFVNLLTNAAHAIAPGRIDDHAVTVTTATDSRGFVTVEVRDTGRGMPQEVLAHVFEPFYTTRRDEGGTGLGLAICHGIVTGFGGEISVESDEGFGTAVRVALPPARPELAEAAAPAEARPVTGTARILVVDDEALLLEIIGRMLRDYDVRTTVDAREALAMVHGGESFDVILVDVTMPHMSGIAFYEALADARPDLAPRVVFMSGGVFEAASEAFLAGVPNRRIEKPFRGAAMRSLITDVLGPQHRH